VVGINEEIFGSGSMQ